jgi:hypothetical protein
MELILRAIDLRRRGRCQADRASCVMGAADGTTPPTAMKGFPGFPSAKAEALAYLRCWWIWPQAQIDVGLLRG